MKSASVNKSPETARHKLLGMISPGRAEALLYDWVNVPLHPLNRRDHGKEADQYRRMISRYPEIFTFSNRQESYRVLGTVSEGLRKIWLERNVRQRDWDIYTLRDLYQRAQSRSHLSDLFRLQPDDDFFPGLPQLTPFEAAMVYLQGPLAPRMQLCRNPECVAPYFFRSAKVKVQKFCSHVCGNPARRASKLRSYHAHKTEWPSVEKRSKRTSEHS